MHIPNTIHALVANFAANLPPAAKRDYFRLHRYRFEALLAAVPPGSGKRVLEIGVNPGLCTELLVQAGYTVSGTDLFPEHRAELWQRLTAATALPDPVTPHLLEPFNLVSGKVPRYYQQIAINCVIEAILLGQKRVLARIGGIKGLFA